MKAKDFDWMNHESTAPDNIVKPNPASVLRAPIDESPYDRKLRMLSHVSTSCIACSMCSLGLKPAVKNDTERDPHVFSNLNPTRFMVVGQNPGWTELEKREPFVGAAGKNFDNEIAKHGLSRSDFYICNTVRCYTAGNTKPTIKNKQRCEPFLQIEINILKPLLVITLGEPAFSQFCPSDNFSESLKSITKSDRYNISVFAIYHPSPLNFRDSTRRGAFNEQIRVMCKLVKALKKKHNL